MRPHDGATSVVDHHRDKNDCRTTLHSNVLAIFERLCSHIAPEKAVDIGAMCL